MCIRDRNNTYDGKKLNYLFSVINNDNLKLKPFLTANKVSFNKPPSLLLEKEFPVSASFLLESLTNYSLRKEWTDGVDDFQFNESEVTRLGSKHVCVINEKHLNFVAVTKDVKPGQLVYGELTTSPSPVDKLYQFYIITPITEHLCKLNLEIFIEAKSPLKKIAIFLFVKKIFKKNIVFAMDKLHNFIKLKNNL